MAKYIKKSIVIEAIQYNNLNKEEIEKFVGLKLNSELFDNGVTPPIRQLIINTLEGKHIASPGDYIIRGIKGEYYPCKPDIFEMTYNKVDDEDNICDPII